MPNWYPSWTRCSLPANFRPAPYGGVVAIAIIGVLMGGGWIALTLGASIAPGVALALAVLCIAGIMFCNWWLNVRLICLGGDRSAIGAIYHLEPPEPTDNPYTAFANVSDLDTDYSFNLLLYQFAPKHQLPSSFVSDQWSAGAFRPTRRGLADPAAARSGRALRRSVRSGQSDLAAAKHGEPRPRVRRPGRQVPR